MSGRQSFIVQAARLVQRLPLAWLRVLEAPFVQTRTCSSSHSKLIFILALPRSGSTLTYQCLIHGLQPRYLSNLWNLLYALPWAGGCLSARKCANYQSDFQSSHGFVQGICGPAEGLRFWSYWCGCGLDELQDVPMRDTLLTRRVDYLRRTFALLATTKSPFVSGYLGHVLAVEKLRQWFPEAIFVRLHRDPLSNAASILRSRKKGAQGWFSVFPKECASSKGANVYEQVASQVYWLNRRLEAVADDKLTIHISYEGLCQNPRAEVQRVVDFCNERGMQLQIRQEFPRYFDYRLVRQNESSDTSKLYSALNELQGVHGSLGIT